MPKRKTAATPKATSKSTAAPNQKNTQEPHKDRANEPATRANGEMPPSEMPDERDVPGEDLPAVPSSAAAADITAIAAELSSRVVRLPGEGRSGCHERLRRLARASGLPRGQGPGTAYNWALEQVDRLFAELNAPPEPEPETATEPEPEPEKRATVASFPETAAVPAPPKDEGDVSGLSDLPDHWPELPANAQLQVEIAWVNANRLRVRSGTGVDLSRALSPAPSYSALSWLETSILFPAKFADISVKATAQSDDEREHIRREKMAIEEIRSILGEMLAPGDV